MIDRPKDGFMRQFSFMVVLTHLYISEILKILKIPLMIYCGLFLKLHKEFHSEFTKLREIKATGMAYRILG